MLSIQKLIRRIVKGIIVASLVLGVAGAAVGSLFGQPQLGYMVGSALGAALFPPAGQDGPRLNDLKAQNSVYGAAIPIIYGTFRTAGNTIWSAPLVEHAHEQDNGSGGGGSTSYTYTCSFAMSLCEGPIAGVKRVWADGKLIYDSTTGVQSFKATGFKLYLGTEAQLPDPTMEVAKGVGNVPAYRGQAYWVFTDLELAKYGNRVPNLTFEVVTALVGSKPSVTMFATDINQGGDTTTYNPIRNEIWNVANSTVVGIDRIDPETGVSLGTISAKPPVTQMESGIFGNPQYDPVHKRVYVLGFGPSNMVIFDAISATLIGSWPWASGTVQYFTISPVTGNVWACVGNNVNGRLQEKDWATGATITDVAIPNNFDAELVADKVGNIWLTNYDWVKRYNVATGTFDFTYTDLYGTIRSVYDTDRDSLWVSTSTYKYGNTPNASILSVTRGATTLVEYSKAGTNYATGDIVEFSIPSGGGMGELSRQVSTITVLGPSTLSVPIDSTNFAPFIMNGAILGPQRVVRELNVSSLTVVQTAQIGSDGFGLTMDLMYDSVHKILWVLRNSYLSLVGVNTSDASLYGGIAAWPPYFSGYYPFWVTMAGSDIWVNDSSYTSLVRIRLSGGATPVPVTLSSIIKDVSTRVGLLSSEVDVTQLTDTVLGYSIPTPMSARAAIDPLSQAYFFGSVDSDSKIKFVKRGANPVVSIPVTNALLEGK